MPDRIEREIEEILAKLDQEPPPRNDRTPISILAHRGKARPGTARPAPPRRARPRRQLPAVTPATLLLAGAALVVGGLLASNVWGPLIWASFAGVLIFLGAFAWSFVRTPRPTAAGRPEGVFWRDRYIQYEDVTPSPWQRFRRRFRR